MGLHVGVHLAYIFDKYKILFVQFVFVFYLIPLLVFFNPQLAMVMRSICNTKLFAQKMQEFYELQGFICIPHV